MKDLVLRGMSAELHTWIKERAEANGRSVNAEILYVLGQRLADEIRIREREARLDAFRKKYVPEGGFGLDAVKILRCDRDHGH